MLGILRSILVQPLGETYCQTSSRGHTPVQTVGRHAHVAPMSYFGVRQFFSTSRVEEVTQSLLNQLEKKPHTFGPAAAALVPTAPLLTMFCDQLAVKVRKIL